MAIDLVATLRLQDDFSGPMQKAIRKMDTASKSAEKLERASNKTTGGFKQFSGGVRSLYGGISTLITKLNPVALGITAIGTAAAGAYTSMKLFNATVGKAMEAELGEVSIAAMFETPKETEAYLKMIKAMALDSPVLNYSDMSGGSKKLLTLTRDAETLEKTWKNIEKLQAYMPEQSTGDALRGIAELASGDIVSLKEVFNLDKNQLNELKDLTFEKQVEGLDKMLNRMKITDDFIAKIGDTSSAKWNQIKEKFDSILTDVGKPSLDALNTFFDGVLTRLEGEPMQKFAEWGGRAINSMVTGLSNGAIKIYDWFTALSASEEFQKRSTLTGKINFVIEDIADKFRKWYEEGGRDKIVKFGTDVAQVLVSALDATPEVLELGTRLGESIWSGIVSGVKKAAKESPIAKYIDVAGFTWKYSNPTTGLFNAIKDIDKLNVNTNQVSPARVGLPSHYHGIDYVPRDQYQASLHKGERVLTAQENKAYSEGKSGKGDVVITGNNFTVREEADIEKIAYKLAKLIEKEASFVG